MKLLLDENLSRRLIGHIEDLLPESIHVIDAGLLTVSDSRIWEFAKENDYTMLTADSDFYERATTFGAPPKII